MQSPYRFALIAAALAIAFAGVSTAQPAPYTLEP